MIKEILVIIFAYFIWLMVSYFLSEGFELSSCPKSRKVLIPLHCSLNMLEGDTGYSLFLLFFWFGLMSATAWLIEKKVIEKFVLGVFNHNWIKTYSLTLFAPVRFIEIYL